MTSACLKNFYGACSRFAAAIAKNSAKHL